MSDIAPISPTANAAPTSSSAQTTSSRKEVTSDFETFLKMLTVQLENQDPLNPMDSSEYAVQLATFSSVEQQVKTNELLGSLLTASGGIGIGQYAEWVGMQARSEAPAKFDGAPVELTFPDFGDADSAELVVSNENGVVVQRLDVPLDSRTFNWDGVDSSGRAMPLGSYSFKVDLFQEGDLKDIVKAQSFSNVVEVRSDAGVTVLVTDAGAKVDPNSVSALRTSQ